MSYKGKYNRGVGTLVLSKEFERGQRGSWARNQHGEIVACFEVSGWGKFQLDYDYNYFLYKYDELKDMLENLREQDDGTCAKTSKLCAIITKTLWHKSTDEMRINEDYTFTA